MKDIIKKLLRENIQQADKLYFNNGKLSKEDRDIVFKITNGDNYTKIITDIYYVLTKERPSYLTTGGDISKTLIVIYKELLNYNNNVFPISNFNNLQPYDKYQSILKRKQLIEKLNELPSIAIRNLKGDIRKERNINELDSELNSLDYFLAQYSLLSNRNPEQKRNIEKKMFRSGITFNDLYSFAGEKENLLGGENFDKKKIIEIIKNDDYGELEIKYNKNDIMIVEVSGPYGIKKIGCNSLWCFTYSRSNNRINWTDWDNYSTNGLAYVIINFNEKSDSSEFMHVLIKPLLDDYSNEEDEDGSGRLFDMSNETIENPNWVIEDLLEIDRARRIMNFGIKVPMVKQKKQKFVDPNQLSLELSENKRLIQKVLRKNLLKEEYDTSANTLFGYHITSESNIEGIKKTGLKIGGRRMQGSGLYAFYDYDHAMRYLMKGEVNNPVIVKFNITTPSRLLYLNMDIAKQVLGDEYHLVNQCENYFYNGIDGLLEEVNKTGRTLTRDELIAKLNKIEIDNSEGNQRDFCFSLIPSTLNDRLSIVWDGNYGLEYRINNLRIVNIIGITKINPSTGVEMNHYQVSQLDKIPDGDKFKPLKEFMVDSNLDDFSKTRYILNNLQMKARNNRDFNYYSDLIDLLDDLPK
jgi:hypothetical protein